MVMIKIIMWSLIACAILIFFLGLILTFFLLTIFLDSRHIANETNTTYKKWHTEEES